MQDYKFCLKQTICVQLVGTFVTRHENQNSEFIKQLQQDKDNFSRNYILVQNEKIWRSYNCCQYSQTINCMCNKTLFKIAPYVKEFMNSTRIYFELICLSDLSQFQTLQIVNHLEKFLYKPKAPRRSITNCFIFAERDKKKDIYFTIIISEA